MTFQFSPEELIALTFYHQCARTLFNDPAFMGYQTTPIIGITERVKLKLCLPRQVISHYTPCSRHFYIQIASLYEHCFGHHALGSTLYFIYIITIYWVCSFEMFTNRQWMNRKHIHVTCRHKYFYPVACPSSIDLNALIGLLLIP